MAFYSLLLLAEAFDYDSEETCTLTFLLGALFFLMTGDFFLLVIFPAFSAGLLEVLVTTIEGLVEVWWLIPEVIFFEDVVIYYCKPNTYKRLLLLFVFLLFDPWWFKELWTLLLLLSLPASTRLDWLFWPKPGVSASLTYGEALLSPSLSSNG